MLRWLFVALHLLVEAGAARRDARIRFLKAQIEILRRKLGGNRVIPSPDDRARLLRHLYCTDPRFKEELARARRRRNQPVSPVATEAGQARRSNHE